MPKDQLSREKIIKNTGELINLLRHELGSISFAEAMITDEPQLTDAEFNERAGAAEIFYMQYMEKALNALEYQQLQKIATEAQNDAILAFDRGIINGLYLVREWFLRRVSESRARFEPKEKIEPGENL
jgi:hypothetical protein